MNETRQDCLFQAIRDSHSAWVDELLRDHPDLANRPHQGLGTPLEYSVQFSCPDVILVLLQNGAIPNDYVHNCPLHKAVGKQDLLVIQLFLSYSATVNQKGTYGTTPLLLAIRNCSVEILRLLLNCGADTNLCNEGEISALLRAIDCQRDLAVIQLLLDYGADPNLSSVSGDTPLRCAVRRNSAAMVQILIDHGARVDDSKLLCSALDYSANVDVVRILLQNGFSDTINEAPRDVFGNTLLLRAIQKERTPLVQLFLEYNVDLNAPNYVLDTPLLVAMKQQSEEMVRFLLEHTNGAPVDTNARNNTGDTPLQLALQWGSEKIVQLLLSHGASVNTTNARFGDTPLLQALRRKSLGIVELLLRYSADVESTCLFYAVEQHWSEAVQLLLRRGANVNAPSRNSGNHTPLYAATLSGDTSLARVLLEHGAKIETRFIFGNTPLFLAIEREDLDMVGLFLSFGAEANAQNSFHETPLFHAIRLGNGFIVEHLLDHGAKPCTKSLLQACQTDNLDVIYSLLRGDPLVVILSLGNLTQ